MGLSASIIEPWELVDFDGTSEYQSVEEAVRDASGKPVLIEVDDGTGTDTKVKVPQRVKRYEKRKHYILQMRRKIVGLRAFAEDVDETQSSFSWLVGPNSVANRLNYASTAKVWVCTRDHLGVEKWETASYYQDQTWEYYSNWETVDPDEFTGS